MVSSTLSALELGYPVHDQDGLFKGAVRGLLDATSLYIIRRHRDLEDVYGAAPEAVSSAAEYFRDEGRDAQYRSKSEISSAQDCSSALARASRSAGEALSSSTQSRKSSPPLIRSIARRSCSYS